MDSPDMRSFATPRESEFGLKRIANASGLSVSVLPNGTIFAIEHEQDGDTVQINQVLGSPLHGGIGRVVLRIGGPERTVEVLGPMAEVNVGGGADRIVWAGQTRDVVHTVTLRLHPDEPVWFWEVDVTASGDDTRCDVVLVQDIGLGERKFLMNNEAYASQYTDHHVARHRKLGPVIMSRQNLAQAGRHPWVAHGSLDFTIAFATDALQVFGPGFRDEAGIALGFGENLPSVRLQHEMGCAILQSDARLLEADCRERWTFFGLYEADHADVSSDADLARIERVRHMPYGSEPVMPEIYPPVRSAIRQAKPLLALDLADDQLAAMFPDRLHEERRGGKLLSFFAPDGPHNRHVVLRAKERLVARRHGSLLRTGQAMLPDEQTLCATVWMHGVFAAQLTIGNTSFHKLFSVSRDPYNVTRASGLRILVDCDLGWLLLATPSAFDMGLSDCRWIYRLDDRVITVHAVASGEHPAMQWRVTVAGKPCRFLVFGQLVLGEREYEHAGRVDIDPDRRRFSMRPDPHSLFGGHYPEAVYHLVTGTPDEFLEVGGDELLTGGEATPLSGHIALRTWPTAGFSFAVVGSLTDPAEASRLAEMYEQDVAPAAMLAPAARYWTQVCRDLGLHSDDRDTSADVAAIETAFPWFAHNAMIHLTVPRGLEQYSGAAWGVRDVCQGPIEFLLALEHDAPAKEILRIVFAEQSETRGDWPQWFMLDPYARIRDPQAHGDVIVWPLKALCDYVEATNDFSVLDERVSWRCDDMARSNERDSIHAHVEALLANVKASFIPGTHLIRYGEGDWNDSLQPADPTLRDSMVSSWTVALLYQQITRYAEMMRRAGRVAAELDDLAAVIAADFHRRLVRDGVVAGYAIFGGDEPELLLHPSDRRTGLGYSLLPMTRGMLAGLFTPEQAAHHLGLIREHLLFPDGVRLMNKPVPYSGGLQTIFRRAESAAFFGREIGLMYTHAHLRYAEAMAVLGEADALWDALAVINPIAVTERLAHASLRQRNAFFSSSDAAFPDRYAASAEWDRVASGRVPVDGGWRIYSSGPGLFGNILVRCALGLRRYFGGRIVAPALPSSLRDMVVRMTIDGERRVLPLSDTMRASTP